ncbi:hypothetical protein [Acinetobacter sp. MD2(2019)]|uniref:hypothetical protein n=1 Tax=Acinetobacter sp. MD2(2019) TaxID=2605273 RepID=UPI002D1E6938|nr:hypothetical protein [Acinetobacter sp. MD2(2019)]MEB3755171.1 hypothetical protein [Acinetobacter sp. MD2(2019)]
MSALRKTTLISFTICSVLFSHVASATTCISDTKSQNAARLGDKDSWALGKTQANKTWDDWIWRGPIFKCTNTGTISCSYAWNETKTTGYSWGVGTSLDMPKGLPIIGDYLSLIHFNAKYDRQQSFSTSFTWTVNIQPGYYAQPIQVVVRRWVSGDFQGMQVATGKECSYDVLNGRELRHIRGHEYYWDGSIRYGHWQTNKEESRYATYYIHK